MATFSAIVGRGKEGCLKLARPVRKGGNAGRVQLGALLDTQSLVIVIGPIPGDRRKVSRGGDADRKVCPVLS